MSDRYSKLIKDLEPYIVKIVRRVGAGSGSGSSGSAINLTLARHALNDTAIHTGTLADSQAPQFLLRDGSRPLTGNLSVAPGVTIDGVDLDVHAANPDAHHKRATSGPGVNISPAQQASVNLRAHSGMEVDATGLALGAPGTLSVSSADAVSGASHSHAIASSSDVSAGGSSLLRSTPEGGLGLASLFTSGAADIGQSLTAGRTGFRVIAHTHDYDHVHVVVNPGPSWTLDEQFGLDVDDNLLVRGWIVGKHAIQIKDAVMLLHFDGPEPYQTNFKGQARGHMGQAPTTYGGGVIYREGVFGKAVQLAESTTNLITNPSFELDLGNWNDYVTGSATGTRERTSDDSKYGQYSLRLTRSSDGEPSDRWGVSRTFPITAGEQYTISFWTKTSGLGSARLVMQMYRNGMLAHAPITDVVDEWRRIERTFTANETGAANLSFYIDQGAGSCLIDAVQLEQKPYATPYCDGSLGGGEFDTGHSWSGTAHASSSTRPNGFLQYAYTAQTLTVDRGTIMGWVYHETADRNNIILQAGTGAVIELRRNSNKVIQARWGGSYISGITIPEHTWHHYAMTFDGTALRLYIDGKLEAAGAGTTDTAPTRVLVGIGTGMVDALNGLLDDLVIVGRALSEDEIRAIYESNAPVFAETSTWHWRAGRNRLWVDAEGMWGYGAAGAPILGLYAGDEENPSATKLWGGANLSEGDLLLGRYGAADGGWMWFDQDLVGGKPAWKFGYADKTVLQLDSGGASLTGVLDIDPSGGIYQGSGSFASPTTGLKIWNQGGVGRIAGYSASEAQWYAGTDGKLYAGGGNVILDAAGLHLISTPESLRWEQTLGDIYYSFYKNPPASPPLKQTLFLKAHKANSEFVVTGFDQMRVLGDLMAGAIKAEVPSAGVRIEQPSTTGAGPVLWLLQNDVSEEFIQFNGPVGTNNAISNAPPGAYNAKIRVSINGQFRWIHLYSD